VIHNRGSRRQALRFEPKHLPADNRYQLLENGEQYFPEVFAAIAAAQREVLVETFILFEDAIGDQLRLTLIAASTRGIRVDLTVDGYGSLDLSETFIETLTAAGVRLHVYDPKPRVLGMRVNLFRRLHRKIVSVDGSIAFVGGINFGVDHLLSHGSDAKQDYAVRISGPLAREIHSFALLQVAAFERKRAWWPPLRSGRRRNVAGGDLRAKLVIRDNAAHRNDIERQYRTGLRTARREVIIANAYFFPGYLLLKQIQLAARRGVKVKLILQGAPDIPQARTWATMLYPALLRYGVEIHEYRQRPLHAKVAVIDDEWTTIGSSNLDPLSLALNLEANVVIHDREFNRQVRERLEPLLRDHCRQVHPSSVRHGSLALLLCNLVAYHATRHFPKWAGWLPAHIPSVQSIGARNRQKQRRPSQLGVARDDFRH
jgi:cardiolipin synthase